MKTIPVFFLVGAATLTAAAADRNISSHSCCAASEKTEATPAVLTDRSVYQLDSTWTNDSGAALKLSSLRGRPQIVTMFFANCNYACPLLVYQMKQMEEALPEAVRGKVGFTLLSFDPERDSPAVLRNYRQQHGLAAERWTLLEGNPDAVLELAALLDVRFHKDAQGQFLHSNVITLLNAEGEVVYQKLGLTSSPDELVQRAARLAAK